jgi:hypothetical protein
MSRIRNDFILGILVGLIIAAINMLRIGEAQSHGQQSTPRDESDDSLDDYRRHLVDARQKSQESYDKTVLSLSSGSLGVSFAFLKSVVGSGPHSTTILLFSAWTFWAISATVVLTSYS